MFISPINPVSSVNAVNRKSVNRTQSASMQPSFKQENYARVFNELYNKRLPRGNVRPLGEAYDTLKEAAMSINKYSVDANFYSIMSKKPIFYLLSALDGRITTGNGIAEIAEMIKSKGALPLITLPSGRNIMMAFDNGKYKQDNVLSEKMRRWRNQSAEIHNFEISFADVNTDRVIAFGLDYEGDEHIIRTNMNSDTIDHSATYYMPDGPLKEEIKDGIATRYNRDNSKWTGGQWAVDDVEQSLRNTIKLFTGWDL